MRIRTIAIWAASLAMIAQAVLYFASPEFRDGVQKLWTNVFNSPETRDDPATPSVDYRQSEEKTKPIFRQH